MPFKSLFPPLPPIPDENHYYILSGLKETAEPDYVLHIDGLTGYKRTRKEFDERVLLGLTVLTAPTSKGGLGLSGASRDVVGVLSYNCMVRALYINPKPLKLTDSISRII